MSPLVWLTLLACSSLASSQNLSPNNGMSIFILAGQSNMAGRGYNGSYVPLECRPNPMILRLTANLTWEEARDPLHVDIDLGRPYGVGPGMPFANSLLERGKGVNTRTIGLVPCAHGGTSISQWSRGGELYDKMIIRAQAALEGGGVIRALLWYQGESDAESIEDAMQYKSRLEKFFTDVRSDLASPELPVIQVAIAKGEGEHSFDELIRKAQKETQLSNVRCVDAKGLDLNSDNLHLSTPGQIKLGKMLANAFLQIMTSPPLQSSAPTPQPC